MGEMRIDTSAAAAGVQKIDEMFQGLLESLGFMVEKMEELVELMAPQEQSFFAGLIGGADVFNTLADGRTNLEGIFEAVNKGMEATGKNGERFNIFKALIPEMQSFAETFGNTSNIIEDSMGGLGSAFSGTSILWMGAIGAVIAAVMLLIENWDSVKEGVIAGWEAIQGALGAASEWFHTTIIQPVLEAFSGFWNSIVGFAADAWEAIKGVFGAVAEFFGSVFSNAWKGVVSVFSSAGDIFNDIVGGVGEFFIGVVNGLIDGINAVVAVPFNGINFALGLVKGIEIFGVRPFEGLGLIHVPQIPKLAQGAVLPANRPFLAVVGDQRQGTNVEAPLGVIQEAVALELAGLVQSNLAGHEATVAVLRQILEAVLGIDIGDDVIGRAAGRYNAAMAVMRGGRS